MGQRAEGGGKEVLGGRGFYIATLLDVQRSCVIQVWKLCLLQVFHRRPSFSGSLCPIKCLALLRYFL